MTDIQVLIKRGILRRCKDCAFRTTSRTEFRKHQREMLKTGHVHVQNMKGVDVAKRYSEEERAARIKAKHGNRI